MKDRNRLLSSSTLAGATFTAVVGAAAIYSPTPAFAASSMSSSSPTYGFQSVSVNNNAIAWPGTATLTSGGTVSPGAFLTLTLPSGMTFASGPTTTTSSHTRTSAITSFAGSSVVTWTLGGSTSTGDTYVFSSFNITTGSAITGGSTTPFRLTVALTGTSGSTSTISGLSANAFYATSGWTASFTSLAATINTSSGANGSLFVTSSVTGSRVAQLGSVQYDTFSGPVSAATGTAQYSLPSGTLGGLTVTGNLGQITRAYLVPGAGCQSTVAATLPSTAISSAALTSASATFSSLVTGSYYSLCVENVGSSLISQTPIVSAVLTPTNNLGSSASAISGLSYSGTANTLDYVVGGSTWLYFIRAVNTTSASAQLFATVTKDDGTTFAGSVTTNLTAGTAALYSIDQINTATGANLTTGDRARVNVLTSTSVNVSGLLYNAASGVVVPLSTRP
jgi:hypothetical protein